MNTAHTQTRLPSTARMYRAVVERDAAFEGVFVVGVKSTGVFCRPGCTARTPNAENCRYFASPREALHAGFRACLRCRPLESHTRTPPVARRLMKLVEDNPGRRLIDADLRELGIDPSTARRQFRRHCGMTFAAYQRARRMGMALQVLRSTRMVEHAMEVGAYASHSGFGAAFNGLFGGSPSTADDVTCLAARPIATPLGEMVAVADEQRLWMLEFHDRRALESELARLRTRRGAAIVPGDNAVLRQIAGELDEYFRGVRRRFDTPLRLNGSAFQQQVWKGLLAIPYGATTSYAALARAVGRPDAQRAVGRANGENRIAIVIPCHRVIRSDGTLCGYGGGLWRKQRLLELEARTAGPHTPPPA